MKYHSNHYHKLDRSALREIKSSSFLLFNLNKFIYFALKRLGIYVFYYMLQWHIFKNIFCNESLRYVSTLHKNVFPTASMKFFLFFRHQNTWILIFAETGLREEGSVSEQNISKNIFCIGSFKYNSDVFLSLVLKKLTFFSFC